MFDFESLNFLLLKTSQTRQTACTSLYPPVQASPPPLSRPLFSFMCRIEEPVKTGTYTCDRRALQQRVLNLHVKHSDQIR